MYDSSGPRRNSANLTYDEFVQRINDVLQKQIGVGVEDIDDYDYYDAWERAEEVTETAEGAAANAGFDISEMDQDEADEADEADGDAEECWLRSEPSWSPSVDPLDELDNLGESPDF